MAKFNVNITMKNYGCKNGHIYSLPHWVNDSSFGCPFCAVTEIERLKKSNQKTWAILTKIERSNTAYKGVITKLQNKMAKL